MGGSGTGPPGARRDLSVERSVHQAAARLPGSSPPRQSPGGRRGGGTAMSDPTRCLRTACGRTGFRCRPREDDQSSGVKFKHRRITHCSVWSLINPMACMNA